MKIISLIKLGCYYPIRYKSGKHFSEYQWHRYVLGLEPGCTHKYSKLISANLKTLTTKKLCQTCGEVITTIHLPA